MGHNVTLTIEGLNELETIIETAKERFAPKPFIGLRIRAALREVYEETGIKAEIVRYLGFVKYFYIHQNGEEVHKTVHYYYMKPAVNDAKLKPLRSEGFAVADYIPFEKVIIKLRYGAEKNMVKTAMSFYGKQKKGRKK